MIRALLGFSRRSDSYVSARGHLVHNSMDGNRHFPKPPVQISDLKTALENFDTSIVRSADGGKKAMAAKRHCRHIVVEMLRQLGHYVEAACKGDLATFLSSGFELVRAPGATEQCPQPEILKIKQGKTGELYVSFTPFYRKAVHYQLRHGPEGVDGANPTEWTINTFLQARRPALVTNLTPGTVYKFQVRAFGKTGEYTPWSGSVTRMCI